MAALSIGLPVCQVDGNASGIRHHWSFGYSPQYFTGCATKNLMIAVAAPAAQIQHGLPGEEALGASMATLV